MKSYKNLVFELYIIEPASRRFKRLENNRRVRAIFDYLAEESQVEKMIESTKGNRPAMEAVICDVERLFKEDIDFDLQRVYQHRQIMGSMIRYIMGHYGYWAGKAKTMKKGSFIKTAIVFYR